MSSASSLGMGVLFVVLSTPTWDQPQNPAGRVGGNPQGTNLPPVDSSAYAQAMAVLAGRYAGQNVAWELWNEPNNSIFFSTENAASYVQMACGAYRAIKEVAPDATVAAGALSGQDPSWLAHAYTAGLHGCFDVLSLHPYDPTPTPEPTDWQPPVKVAADRYIMVANGDNAKAIWITEFGWYADINTSDPIPVGGVTLAEQATYTINFINEIAKSYPYVTTVMIFNGIDAVGDPTDERYAGILDPNLIPKPVYNALASLYGHG